MAETVIDYARPGALAELQRAFTAHLRDPEHAPPPASIPLARLRLYGDLVFGNIERVMGNMFPVLKSRLAPPVWQRLTREFFRDHPMHDPLFQSMPRAFLDYLAVRAPLEDAPPWLLELAHYEWVEFALSIAPDETMPRADPPPDELLTRRPRLTPQLWLLHYAWPVQRLRAEPAEALTQAEPVYLVAWRDGEDRVRFLELAPSAARLLEMLGEEGTASGASLLRTLADEMGVLADEAFVATGAATLDAWRATGIIVAVT